MSTRELKKTTTPGIYRRGNGYVAHWYDALGHQHKISGRTLAEVKRLRAEKQADVSRGEYRALSRLSFRDYAARWIVTSTGRTGRGLRAETRADYARLLGVTLAGDPVLRDGHPVNAIAAFGRMRLAEVEPGHIKSYAAGWAARGLTPNTTRLYLAPIRAMLADALEEGLIRSNPTVGVRIPRPVTLDTEERHARALTEEELARLVEHTPERWRLLVTLLAETGLRIGECLALEWDDVDAEDRQLHVRRRIYRGRLGPPKSGYGKRTVPLSVHVAEALAERQGDADDLVFPNRDGGYLDPGNLFGRWFKPAARAAGVPWAGFHSLRHTAASRLFRAGWSAPQVQLTLGHHSPAFTMSTYVHLVPSDVPPSPFGSGLRVIEGGKEGARGGLETAVTPTPAG